MQIMVKKCNEPVVVKEIEKLELEDMQNMVGGLIEHLWCGDDIDMWLNDEGKMIGLPPNLALVHGGECVDLVMGDVFFTSNDGEGGTTGLSDENIAEIEKRFGIIQPMICDNDVSLVQVFTI